MKKQNCKKPTPERLKFSTRKKSKLAAANLLFFVTFSPQEHCLQSKQQLLLGKLVDLPIKGADIEFVLLVNTK